MKQPNGTCLSEALRRAIRESLLLRTLQNTEYQGQAARPSKLASRALAWREARLSCKKPFIVFETDSYPGVLSTFYLALGATVMLHDSDEALLRKVYAELSEGHGDAVRDGGRMEDADIIDFDSLGVPTSDDLRKAAATSAVLVVTDASGINRRRNGFIPELFRQLAGSPEGRWSEEKREPEALWRAVAQAVGRSLSHFVQKSGAAPAWCAVI